MKKVILWLIIDLLLIFLTRIPDIIGNENIIIKCFEIERGTLIGITSTYITWWLLKED